jgi:AmmeMemoRadiSam system protein B
MMPMERPCLRPCLVAYPDEEEDGLVRIHDRLGLCDSPVAITQQEFHWLRLFDGRRTLTAIAEELRNGDGRFIAKQTHLESLVARLEESLFLDSPSFRQVVDGPVRAPRFIGCYDGNAATLRNQLRALFVGPKGPGLPRRAPPDGSLHAALIPHIDYPRGGPTYTWGFKEVVERTDASLFVIIGTSHHSLHRFTLTRKHFETPLGITPTDQDYIDRLVRHYGPGLFDDEWQAHLPEHSIELEVVFLQYLYEDRRPIRMVPLVVGSFYDCVEDMRSPVQYDDIGRMVRALQLVEQEVQEPICYIISGDLAHIGPKFGDRTPVREPVVTFSRQQDQAILQRAESASAEQFFQVVAAEQDARRICGLPPAYTVLAATTPRAGKVLHYDQYVHPRGFESVSFASVAYYR